ncbi:hypothetical protein J437_LFUL014976 [Ladona fulva]|uniref:Endonuclease/exonuclease/phosphatase domain-containing protein n=1 Tax=Ladona fulva TaxID=123851 RepID=A0A8K0P7P1_LADFU|nr:hypothetical protein J437_LFUL014976 [Ladona fulva]
MGPKGNLEGHQAVGRAKPLKEVKDLGCRVTLLSVPGPRSKRPRLVPMLRPPRGKKKMAIIPESYPAVVMTQEWHIEMEGKLEELWGSTPEGQALPSFEGTRLINGALEVICKDDYSTTRFVIGVDEASAGTVASPGFRNSIGLHEVIFSFLGKPGDETETEAPGESIKMMGEEVGEGGSQIQANLQHSRAATGVLEEILSKDPPPNKELKDLVNFCKTKSWDLLIGYDSNSHHSVSQSSDVNPRGESLLEYLMTTELQLLNRGSQPTIRNNVREEVIDITLCTSNIVHKIKEWRVSEETSLSDLGYVLFTLNEEAGPAIVYRNQLTWAEITRQLWDDEISSCQSEKLVAAKVKRFQYPNERPLHFLNDIRNAVIALGLSYMDEGFLSLILNGMNPLTRSTFIFQTRPTTLDELYALLKYATKQLMDSDD